MVPELNYQVYCYSCHCIKCDGRDMYVGKAKHGTQVRHDAHINAARRIILGRSHKKDLRFDHLMAQHGIENLRVRTLGSYVTEDEMNAAEVRLIVEHKTFFEFGGMNFDRGGRGGRRGGTYSPSAEARQNMSASLKKGYEADPDRRFRVTKGLIEKGKAWRDANPGAMKEVVKRGWETVCERIRTNSEYAERFATIHQEKSRRGGEAFLAKHIDPEFAEAFAEKCGAGVKAWCDANPEKVKLRSERATASRVVNGTWLKAVRKAAEETPKSEYTRRGIKGWETRRARRS